MSNYSDIYCPSVKDIIEWVNSDPVNQQVLSDWKQAVENDIANPDTNTNNITTNIPVIFHLIHMGETVGSGMNLEYSFVPNLLNNINQKISFLNIKLVPARVDENNTLLIEPGLERINGSTLNRTIQSEEDIVYNYVTHGVAHTERASIPGILQDTIKETYHWDVNSYFNIYIVNSLNDKLITENQKLLGSSTMPFILESEEQENLFGIVMPVKSLGISETIPLLFDYSVGLVKVLQSISYDCKNVSDYFNFVNSLDGNSFIHNLLHCFGLIDIHFPSSTFGCNIGKSGELFNNISLGGSIYDVNNPWERRYDEKDETNSCDTELGPLDFSNSPTLVGYSPSSISFSAFDYSSSKGSLSASFSSDDDRTYEFYDNINQEVLQEGSYSYLVTDATMISNLLSIGAVSTFITTSSELPTTPPGSIDLPTFGSKLDAYGGYYAGLFNNTIEANINSSNTHYNDAIVNAFTDNASLNPYLLFVSYSYNFIGRNGVADNNYQIMGNPSPTTTSWRVSNAYILPWLNDFVNQENYGFVGLSPFFGSYLTHIQNHNGLGDWDFPWYVEAEAVHGLDSIVNDDLYEYTESNDIVTKNMAGTNTVDLGPINPASVITYPTTDIPVSVLYYNNNTPTQPIFKPSKTNVPNSVFRVVRRVPYSQYESDQNAINNEIATNSIQQSSSIYISHHGYNNINPSDVQNINISYDVISLTDTSIEIENLSITVNYIGTIENDFTDIKDHPMHHSFLSFDVSKLSNLEIGYLRACFNVSYILTSLKSSYVLEGEGCSNGGFFVEYDSVLDFDAYINSSTFSLSETLNNVINLSNNQNFINQYSSRIQNFNTTLSTITQNFLDG